MVYVSAGAGHRRAAEAIAQAAGTALPDADVRCQDLLGDTPWWLRNAYPATYYLLVRHLSRLWGGAFELFDHPLGYALAQPIRRVWNALTTRRFVRRLRTDPPDLVMTTHFLPADVVSACKRAGWLRAPLLVIVTDFHPHRFWLSREADAYVLALQEGVRTVQGRGIPANRLHALGIPIGNRFHMAFDRGELLQLFHLDPARRTILVTSGGTTVGPFERVVKSLMALEDVLPKRIQLLVICGEDAAAAHRLYRRAQQGRMPVRVYGFINTMPEAMAASELVVAKAGGLTVTEALGRGLPLILYHAIPGQERMNAQYVVQHGAALFIERPQDVAGAVRRLFEQPEQFTVMRKAAQRLSRPEAAETIVQHVVKPLLEAGVADGR